MDERKPLARGRSRGRATRGGAVPATSQPVGQPVAQTNGHGGNGNGANGNGQNGGPKGRAAPRGGIEAQRPGAGGGVPTDHMARLAISGGGTGDPSATRTRYMYQEYRSRPAHVSDKRGTQGQPIQVVGNYYALQTLKDRHIYQYHVDFVPECPNFRMRKGMMNDHKELIGDYDIFDGAIMYLPIKLKQDPVEVISNRHDQNYQLTIKLTNLLAPDDPQTLVMMNTFVKRMLDKLEWTEIRRCFYLPQCKVEIPQHKLEVWPGYQTAISQYDGGLLINVDTCHKVLHVRTAMDVMLEVMNSNMPDARKKEAIYKQLVGTIVMTRYNNRTYRVDDIDWDQNPESTFTQRKTGEKISYVDYYRKHYDLIIQEKQQPLILSKKKVSRQEKQLGKDKPEETLEPLLFFVPEFCTLTGLSDDMRSNFRMMKDLDATTKLAPAKKAHELDKFVQTLHQHAKIRQDMQGWGIEINPELRRINARMLPPEKIILGDPRNPGNPKEISYDRERTDDFAREFRSCQMITGVHIQNWIMLACRGDEPKAENLLNGLHKVGPPLGIRIGSPETFVVDNRPDSFVNQIRQSVTENTQLVLVLLPNNRKDKYDAVKKTCCIDKPVPSQCVVAKTTQRNGFMSIATKIAIQLNCKLGGEAWTVKIPINNTMVVGIDTYHDSAQKGRSVAGVVCSLNKSMTRYFSRVSWHSQREELHRGLTMQIKAACEAYYKVNGSLPERIIIYRDGVGDGQLAALVEHELPQILEGVSCLGTDYQPKLAFVVVKKRINTRFFLPSQRGYENVHPGTVVDSEVTRPEWYDFFLVSQRAREGTVSPTAFNVVHDTSGFKPDHMQMLTYKLCHLYYNWAGTVRVPAPCQYAHKLAFLAGQSLHRDPAIDLSDRLYFL